MIIVKNLTIDSEVDVYFSTSEVLVFNFKEIYKFQVFQVTCLPY